MGGKWPLYQSSRRVFVSQSTLQAGHSFLPRGSHARDLTHNKDTTKLLLLHHCLEPLESLMKCVEMGWLAILVGVYMSLFDDLHTLCRG